MIAVPTSEALLPPQIIRDAIVRTMDPSLSIDLSVAERFCLATLLRRVEARDGQKHFWVRRMNFAAIVGRSDRTVTNWLNRLQALGLINREQPNTWGGFQCLTVHLTELAVQVLGLDQQFAPRKKIAGATNTGQFETKTTGDQASWQNSQNNRDIPTSNPKPRSSVPPDLQFLCDVGLSRWGVFALMRRATERGLRLGDVVAAHSARIVKSRQAFAYVTSLLQLPGEAHEGAQRRQAEIGEKAKADERQNRLWEFWKTLAGRKQDYTFGRTVEFTEPGGAAQLWEGTRYCGTLAGDSLLELVGKLFDSCGNRPAMAK